MPPTRTRPATSAAVRPVRMATAMRSGWAAASRASRRIARRASGTIVAAPGSREPSASVPSKSATTSRRPGRAPSRAIEAIAALAEAGPVSVAESPGQGVTVTPGDRAGRRDSPTRPPTAAATHCPTALLEVAGVAAANGVGSGPARPSGAEEDDPAEQQRCHDDPDDEPGDDRQTAHHGRSVPVRAAGGAFQGPLIPCRSHAPLRGSDPHANRPRHPDRARGRLPRRRPPVVHAAGHRGAGRVTDTHVRPLRATSSRPRSRGSRCRRSGRGPRRARRRCPPTGR